MENTQTCQLRISLKYFTAFHQQSQNTGYLSPSLTLDPSKRGNSPQVTSNLARKVIGKQRKPGLVDQGELHELHPSLPEFISWADHWGQDLETSNHVFFLGGYWKLCHHVLLFCSNQCIWCVCVLPFIHFWERRKSLKT